jgi:putative protease
MGVASLKLEGRMKRAEYVATVTRVYREAINAGYVTPKQENQLLTAFNRQGFTDGYYQKRTGRAMFGIRADKGDDPAWLKEAQQTYEGTENGLVGITFTAIMTREGSSLAVTDPEGRTCEVQGPVPEVARVQEMTADVLSLRLGKTGGTPYICIGTNCHVEPGLTLSAAAINAMRRDVLNQLTALRARRDRQPLGRPKKIIHVKGKSEHPGFTVQITAKEQVTPNLLRMKPAVLYVPLHLLMQDAAWTQALVERVRLCPVLPRIIHDGEMPKIKDHLRILRQLGIRDALVGNWGHVIPVRECGLRCRGDFGLNLYNSAAVNAAAELELLLRRARGTDPRSI